MLKALRVSILLPAAITGATMLPLAGCDKGTGSGTGGTGGSGGSASTGAGKGTVGIVDYDRVFQDVGWKGELERSLSVTAQDYKLALEAFVHEVQRAVADKKKEIAANNKVKLTPAQMGQLERNEKLDQLPLTPELQQQLFNTLQNANNYVTQANNYASNMLRQRRDQLVTIYRQALSQPIRRVSEANGVTMVLIPLENVAYYHKDVDLSAKVVDDVQKTQPVHTVPEAQKLQFPKVESITAPPAPTTLPAALPSAPTTTQPATPPARGG